MVAFDFLSYGAASALLLLVFILLCGVRYIPNDRVGVIEKRWSLKGSVKRGFIALAGEAGYQPHLLRGGLHYLLPLQYRVHKTGLVTILEQLRSRQIAEEQIETYARQERASAKERELREAMARADRQKQLTESEVAIAIEANQGRASYERSVQTAAQVRTMAEAEAMQMRTLGESDAARVRMMGEAQADKVARVGMAEAIAIEEQVRAYGGPRYQLTRHVMKDFSDAIAAAKVDVVPKIMGSGAGGNGNSSVMETLLTMLLSDKLGDGGGSTLGEGAKSRTPELEAMRTRIRSELLAGHTNGVQVPILPKV